MTTRRDRGALGANIRKYRLLAEMSQEDLAKASFVRRATIADIERGVVPGVQADTLANIAAALRVTSAELVFDPDQCPIDPFIQDFLDSPLFAKASPTEDEIRWLRSQTAVFYLGRKPTPESIYWALVSWRAAARRSPAAADVACPSCSLGGGRGSPMCATPSISAISVCRANTQEFPKQCDFCGRQVISVPEFEPGQVLVFRGQVFVSGRDQAEDLNAILRSVQELVCPG